MECKSNFYQTWVRRLFFSVTASLIFCSAQPLMAWWDCSCCDDWLVVENVHGYIEIATNERLRGVTYTDNNPQVLGAIDWSHQDTGVHIGVWSSSNQSTGTDMAIAPYIGIEKKCGNFLYDIYFRYYGFPGHQAIRELNCFDTIASLGYDFEKFVLRAGISYIPKYYFTRHQQLYPYVNIYIPLPCRFSFTGEYGYQQIKKWRILGLDSHSVYDFALTRDFKGFYLKVRHVQTSLKRHEFFGYGKTVWIGSIGARF